MPEGEGRERVGHVVAARQRQAPDREQPLRPEGEPGLLPGAGHAELSLARLAQREGDLPLLRRHHAPHPGVLEIDDRHRCVIVDPALGARVLLQVAVAIEVVGGHVEHRRRRRVQREGALELKARELQHVEIRAPAEQGEGRLAEVGADLHRAPGAPRHLPHHRGHRTLAVRSGHRDHRSVGGAREELDVADDRDAARGRRRDRRFAKRDSGAHHHQIHSLEARGVEAAAVHLHPWMTLPQGVESRGCRTHDVPVRPRPTTSAVRGTSAPAEGRGGADPIATARPPLITGSSGWRGRRGPGSRSAPRSGR